jgi:predicted O-linked N-acetylglucosamine transferase (SPINDLY family)
MRILKERPNSVLWMFAHSQVVEDNLRREAAARDVAPERLVFAAPAAHSQHLARQRQADLFLDTLPCNAHTTATEALMAGVPLVTRKGKTFAGRVAASILSNAGLSDLITETWESYANIALQLSGDPERHRRLKADLAAGLPSAPLFDNARYTAALENAYRIMHNRADEGLPPQSFDVDSP